MIAKLLFTSTIWVYDYLTAPAVAGIREVKGLSGWGCCSFLYFQLTPAALGLTMMLIASP